MVGGKQAGVKGQMRLGIVGHYKFSGVYSQQSSGEF